MVLRYRNKEETKGAGRESITFKIPGLGASMNMAYAPGRDGGMVMVKKAREFREKVITFTPHFKGLRKELKPVFSFKAWVYDNWFRKDGKDLLCKDVGNLRKVLVDAIFYKWAIDDKYIWQDGPLIKCQESDKSKARIVVQLAVLNYLIEK